MTYFFIFAKYTKKNPDFKLLFMLDNFLFF